MPQNLIWLVKWSDRYWEPDPSARPAPEPRRQAVEPYSPASPMEIGCRAASGRRACRHASRHTRRSNARRREDPAPAVVHREHPNGGSGHDDLTVMGIAATAAAAMGREPRINRSTRLRATRMSRQTRSRAQTLRSPSPSLGRCRQVGFVSPPAAPGPNRGLPLPAALGCWPDGHTRRRSHAPGRNPPQADQTRAGRGGGTHRR